MRISRAELAFQLFEIGIDFLDVDLAIALGRILEGTVDRSDLQLAGLDIIDGGLRAGDEGIEFEGGTVHLVGEGISSQLHEDGCELVHLEGLQLDVRATLVEEVEEGLLVFLFDHGLNHGLEANHDSLVGGRKILLVGNRGFQVLHPPRNLEELEVGHRHIDVEGSALVGVALGIALLQKLLVLPDGGFPLLGTDCSIPPLQKGLLVIVVEASLVGGIETRCPGVLIGVLGVALFEGLHRVIPLLQFQLTIALVVPEPSELGTEELHRTTVEGPAGLGENGVGFGPLLGPHGGEGVTPGDIDTLPRNLGSADEGKEDEESAEKSFLVGIHDSNWDWRLGLSFSQEKRHPARTPTIRPGIYLVRTSRN